MAGAGEKRWYEQVRAATKSDPRHGLAICAEALREHPASHGLHFLSGYIGARLGERRAAKWALERATELDPGHAPSWRELADVQISMAREGTGERELATGSSGAPSALESWLCAAESLTAFLGLRPSDASAYLDRASTLVQLGDAGASRMAFVDALCALSLGTLEATDEEQAATLVKEIKHERPELEKLDDQIVDRVRELAAEDPMQAARLAREAAQLLDVKYGLFAAALFADVGAIDQALHELGASLPAVGSESDLLQIVNRAEVPVSNPDAVTRAWNRAVARFADGSEA